MLLEEEAANDDPTAIGLHSQLSRYSFVALFHLTADILSTVDHLGRVFQFRELSFSAVRSGVSM